MRILVCGGAGYIGSHMVRRLVRAGHDPVVFDNLCTGHASALEPAFKGYPGGPVFVRGDLLDKGDLARLFAAHSFDAVMHFSAFALVGESVLQPAKYYENNVAGTLNLLQAMTAAGVDSFIFSSTCATYGLPESMPIVESMPAKPINPYGQSKRMAELMLADFAAAYGLKSVALRYFNAAGADPEGDLGEDHDPESHLIPNVIRAALGLGPELRIFGDDYPTPDGTCVRDYIHVLDLAEAHLLALDSLRCRTGGMFEAFNLGTGQGTSNLEIIRSVENVAGHTLPYSFAPRRPGDPPVLYADPAKACEVLGWIPRYAAIDEIIAHAWHWHAGKGCLT